MYIRRMTVAAIVAMAAAYGVAGWEITSVMKVEGKGDGQQPAGKSHAWVDGEKMRMEYLEGGNPMMGKGGYMLTSDGGKTMYMVDPREKTYTKLDMQAMMGMAGGMMNMMNMKFTNPQVDKLAEERGEAICGYPTTIYKVRSSYGMEMSIMGFKKTTEVTKEEKIWATTSLGDLGAQMFMKQANFKTNNEELDKLIKAEMTKVKGFPLKTISVMTTKEGKGKEQVSKSLMEVVEIKKGSPAASLFEIPSDYKEQSLIPPGAMEDEENQEAKGKHGGKRIKKEADESSDSSSSDESSGNESSDDSSASKSKSGSKAPVDLNKLLKGFKFGR